MHDTPLKENRNKHKVGFSVNAFFHRLFPLLRDWFHGLLDVFTLLNGWICLHGVLDKIGS